MLTDRDIEHSLKLLREEICDFDCGAICASRNRDGVPYCCDNSTAIPVLYREEYRYLKKRTGMWRHHKPKKSEKLEDLEYQIYAKCRGPENCEREHRGIVCRNFPTYPYFDKNGKCVALFFNRTLKHQCYLVDRPALIRKEFIQANVRFWNFILPKVKGEWDFYRSFADRMERMAKRHGINFVLLRP
jgi:hypothetical protein